MGHREPVRRRARHVHGRHQRSAHSAGARGWRSVLSRQQLAGARQPAACVPAEGYRADRRDSDARIQPAQGRGQLHDKTVAQRFRPARSHGWRARRQPAQRRHPQQRLLHQGPGADAGNRREGLYEFEVLDERLKSAEISIRRAMGERSRRVHHMKILNCRKSCRSAVPNRRSAVSHCLASLSVISVWLMLVGGALAQDPTDVSNAPVIGTAALPRDLSPWGMFMSANIVVKAVMIGLIFASVVTWTISLAKGIEVLLAKRKARAALRALAAT